MHKNIHIALLAAATVLVLLLIGCESEDGLVAPDPTGIGTIVIDPSSGIQNTPWNLEGPVDISGFADTTLVDMPIGEYTLTWGTLSGWTSPSNSTRRLVPNGIETFSGQYVDGAEPTEEYVLIPPASVSMPTIFSRTDSVVINEEPFITVHWITITGRLDMSATEVTNRQYLETLQEAYDNSYAVADTGSVQDALDGSTEELLDLGSEYCQINFKDGVFFLTDHICDGYRGGVFIGEGSFSVEVRYLSVIW